MKISLLHFINKQTAMRQVLTHLAIVSVLALTSEATLAQDKAEIIIRGKITDYATSQPLPGASIYIEGTSSGATADANGDYSITVTDPNTTLVISFVGYDIEKRQVGGQTRIDISLIPSLEILTQFIVIGYGEQKRSDVTGSISSLSPDTYKDQAVVTTSAALQGRIAGVSVQNVSGAPGGEVKIRVRGSNSINANNDPLYVVDGIALFSAGLGDINVNDIESIEVLKDASATSIYGSRGSNGVILITTKKGTADQTKVQYNSFVSFNSIMKKYDQLDAVGYAKLANHIAGNSVFANPDALAGTGIDWQDQIFRTSVTQSHQLSASGGTEKARYYLSAYLVDQPGIIINTGQKKYAIRTNIDTKFSDKFSLQLGMFATHQKLHNHIDVLDNGSAAVIPSTVSWAPTEKIYDSEGRYNRYSSIGSPLSDNPYMLAKERLNDVTSNSILVNGTLKYNITDWLTYDLVFGANVNLSNNAYLNNQWINATNPGSGQGSSNSYTLQNSNIITLHKVFADVHDLTVTGVIEETSNRYTSFTANGGALTSETNGYYNLSLNSTQGISSDYSAWGLLSYIGRISYALRDKYLLSATYRADGSSKFQQGNKWGYFPSVAAGWRLSEEPFIQNLNIFSNLKLRASYGQTGNQAINPYSTLGLLKVNKYSYGTGSLAPGYAVGNPTSPTLKWEVTSQTNIGLETSFFNGLLNINADYYIKNTRDLLLSQSIPQYNGGGSKYINIGKVQNKGFEFAANVVAIGTETFSWTSGFNVTSYKNKVVSLGGESVVNLDYIGDGLINTNIQAVKVGESLGSFYLIPWQGLYQQGEHAMGYGPGDNKYEDVDHDGSIGYGDRKVVGSSIPKWSFGFNNSVKYKNFELNIFLQGVQGNKVFNAVYASIASPNSRVKYPTLAAAANYWTPENTSAQFADPASKTNRNYIESTQFLQDGSYVRFKNVSISYTVPKEMLRLANVKLTASAQNLFTITKYKGYDPEVTSTGLATTGTSDAYGGQDIGAYPSARSFTLALSATF